VKEKVGTWKTTKCNWKGPDLRLVRGVTDGFTDIMKTIQGKDITRRRGKGKKLQVKLTQRKSKKESKLQKRNQKSERRTAENTEIRQTPTIRVHRGEKKQVYI